MKTGPRPCAGCGREIAKAHARDGKDSYCGSCYAREFHPVACGGCSRTVRTLGGYAPVSCKHCRTRNRLCMRCHRPTPRASVTTTDGVACKTCAKFFNPPRPCAGCGTLSRYTARDFAAGFFEPACPSCRNKGYITCPGCRKFRPPTGSDRNGRLVCARCLAQADHAYICPACGQPGLRHSATRCSECYWKDRLLTRVRTAQMSLAHPWTRDALAAFAEAWRDRVSNARAGVHIGRHIETFKRLDTVIAHPTTARAEGLVAALGPGSTQRYRLVLGFLITRGILPVTVAELREANQRAGQHRLLDCTVGSWAPPVLERYQQELERIRARYLRRGWVGRHERFRLTTIAGFLRAARRFLETAAAAGVQALQQISSRDLDRFLVTYPGYRHSIRHFVRYLNRKERLFQPVPMPPHVKIDHRQDLILSTERYTQLIGHWLDEGTGPIKERLMCLLVALYAQKIKVIVGLRCSAVSRDPSGRYRIDFGTVIIPLDDRVSALLGRYLASRKALSSIEHATKNDYLFPGHLATDHITPWMVSYYLKKQDVTAPQLVATALLEFCMKSRAEPTVLVRAFGISLSAASHYAGLAQPLVLHELAFRAEAAQRQTLNRSDP